LLVDYNDKNVGEALRGCPSCNMDLMGTLVGLPHCRQDYFYKIEYQVIIVDVCKKFDVIYLIIILLIANCLIF